jgi:hypothetical protein
MGVLIKGIRLVVVLIFLVGMPVLALPPVADWCEGWLYPQTVSRRASPAVHQPAPHPLPENVTPATFTSPAPPPAESLDVLLAQVRSLGAADYRLEEPGESGQYRFVAEFRVEGPLPRRWQYAGVAAEPDAAVRDVIAQISRDAQAR